LDAKGQPPAAHTHPAAGVDLIHGQFNGLKTFPPLQERERCGHTQDDFIGGLNSGGTDQLDPDEGRNQGQPACAPCTHMAGFTLNDVGVQTVAGHFSSHGEVAVPDESMGCPNFQR